MPDNTRKGPPAQGGHRRDDRRNDRGGPRGKGNPRDAAKPVRAETYETVREVIRGAGFKIDKFVLAEKGTHKPVRTEYRLFRDGLDGPRSFARLADAQTAATEPLPEPETSTADADSPAAAEETPETPES